MKTPLDNDLKQLYEAFNQKHEHLRESLMASLPSTSKQHKQRSKFANIGALIGDTIMKSRTTKLAAAAAVIVIAVLLSITFFDKGATPAYGMSEAWELIRQSKTLHVRGWSFGNYHSNTFDIEVSAKLPFEYWYDFENGQYRLDHTYFYWDGKLDKKSTICDGEYEMSEGRSLRTTGEHWKSIKFEKIDKKKTKAGWLEFYSRLDNIEGSHRIDEGTIDGVQFDIWEVELACQTRENGDIDRYQLQTWISPTTGEIGRIKEWRKEDDGPWIQTIEYSTFERNVVLSPDLFVTEPPEGEEYRLENTKETAIVSLETTDLDDIYDHAKWDYAPLAYRVEPIFRLNNGSFLACWQSIDASEPHDQTRYFQNLEIGGDLPKLPSEVYAFSPSPNVRNMQFVGYHLAYTRKGTEKGPRWYEWSLYVPDCQSPPPNAVLSYQIHYRDNTGENKDMSETQVRFFDWQEIESEDDFDSLVLEEIAKRSDRGSIPVHITYEKVLGLSEQIRDSFTQE
jgi:hypothetical protein